MRRGLPLFAALLLAVLAAGSASAARRHSAPPAGPQRFQLTFIGQLSVVHTDQGLQANGAGCNLGPDDTSPYVDNYTLSLRWKSTFSVTLKRKLVQLKAHATSVTGGQYSYSGYAYDFNCQEIIYGAGGQPCTGTLTVGSRGVTTARGSPARMPKRVTFASYPFGSLVATPAECTTASNPSLTYAASDELGLTTIGLAAGRTFKVPVVKRARTYPFKFDATANCSQPPQSAGETESCSTAYSVSGSLRVKPL